MLPPTRFQNLVLASLALSSVAVDAITYLALGKVFTAFKTGNLVFLGLGLAGSGPGAVRPLISLAAFAVGVALDHVGRSAALWTGSREACLEDWIKGTPAVTAYGAAGVVLPS